MSQLPTAEQVTNLYLYGQKTTPSDMTSEALIRARSTEPTIEEIDIATYMAGPGRFASASKFEIVEKFLNPSLFAASYRIPPGVYSKDDLYIRFGITNSSSDFRRKIITIDQAQYDDGQDNFLERAYIWNTTAFMIQDGARFVVEANGNRYIDNFAVVPYSDPTKPENFDFSAGSPFGKYIVNPVLEPKVDPSKIGIKVNFDFINPPTGNRFTYLDYVTASSTAKTANPALYAVITAQGPAFLDRLWQSGATRFVDPDGRAIFYGSDKADSNLSQFRFDYSVVDPLDSGMRTAINQKGVALIGGAGSDRLYGGVRDDYLDGGKDSDTLMGGTGTDTYVFKANEGKDTIIDADGVGRIIVDGQTLAGAKKKDYKLVGGQGRWTVNNGEIIYTLDAVNRKLLISGSALGAESQITINNFDSAKALGAEGYLGIKLEAEPAVTVADATAFASILNGAGNFFSRAGAEIASLLGMGSSLTEGSGKSFTVNLNRPASAGDTLTLHLALDDSALAKAILGDRKVDANGAVITLEEGQTSVSFALVSDGAGELGSGLAFCL